MAKAELEIIVKLKDMAKGALNDLNTGLTGLGTGAAVAAGAGVAAVTAGLINIGDQASNARTILQGLDDVDLTAVLDDAQLLARRYGEDVNKTLAATRTLMEDFGLTSQEANDLIVSGFNRGLDASGDFLDTIGEYSNLFVDGGATAEEFFSLLESGLAGGVLGTDKAADSFKEFGIRLSELQLAEGDMTFAEALDGSGEIVKRMVSGFESALYFTDLSAKEINDLHQGLMDGSKTTADAFKIIVPALAGIESEVERNAAGVQLFGTQWEDLGPQIMSQLTLTGTSMEQLGETAEAERGVILGSLGEVPALIFDKFSLALLPLSDLLLGVANSIMAAEDPLAQLFEEVFKLVPGLEQFAGQGTAIVAAMQPFIKVVQDNLIPIIAGLVAVVGVALVAALGSVIAPIAGVIATTGAFVAALFAVVAAGAKVYETITTQYPGMAIQIKDAFETAKAFVMTAMQVIATVVQTITAAVVGWWQENGDRIIAQVQTTFNTAVAVISSVMMQIEATVATITEVIAKFWATYGDEIIATVNDLAIQLGALWDEIVKLVNAAMIGIGQLINGALSEIQKFWETYGNDIQVIAFNVFNGISQQISGFMEIIRGIVKTVTALIQGDWQGAADGLRTIVDGISTYLVGTWNTIVAVIGPILNQITAAITHAFTAAWNGITGTLTTIQNGITSAFTGAWNGITGTLTTIQNGITNAFTGAWNGITGTLTTIQNGIVNTFTHAWNGITATLTRIQIGIIAAILRAWTGIVTFLTNIRNGIINAIKAAWDGLVANLSKIRQGIIDAVSRAWTGIVTFLTNIRDGIINAIKTAWEGLVANLSKIRQGIIDAVSRAWDGIRDTLSTIRLRIIQAIQLAWDGLIINLGKIKQGIINAIAFAWDGIRDTLSTIRLRIIQAIQLAWDGITINLGKIKQGIIDAIAFAWDGISGVLTNIRNGITNAITGALDAISAPLGNIKTAVIDALTAVRTWLESFSLGKVALGIADSLVGGMIKAISGTADKLKDAFKNLVQSAINSLPKPIRDALALLGFKVTKSAAATLPAPPPTTRGAAVGSVLPGASVATVSSPSIVINIGSVRDARDIDAIRRAVRDGMDEAARRGIVQSQLPRGI
jgi:phage-related protein